MKSKTTAGILFFAAAAIAMSSFIYFRKKRIKKDEDYDWLMW